MKYMGSKSKIAKHIAPIIQSYINQAGATTYWEPFCGGCNMLDHIEAPERLASDYNHYLIALLQNLDKLGKLPQTVSREHYADVRAGYHAEDGRYPEWYIGAIGYLASYNGRFFDGGYSGTLATKLGTLRDYYQEAKQNLEAQAPKLTDVRFWCSDYRAGPDIAGAVIYCDPPYRGRKQYGGHEFDHDAFWAWAMYQSRRNIVLVSEETAPESCRCVWQQAVSRTIHSTKTVQALEHLFLVQEDEHG